MTPKKLIELFDKYKSGDEKSLELICKKAEQFIRPYFEHKFRDENLVNDLCQDTYIRLLFSLKNVRQPLKFKSFVLKTAFYVMQDHFRKSARKLVNFDEFNMDDSKEKILELDPAIDERMLLEIDLKSVIKQLPKKFQLILKLVSEGYKYKEISKIVDLTESGVKMQMKKYIEKLKSQLDR